MAKAKKKVGKQREPELPPVVVERISGLEPAELERVIMHLGHLRQGLLSPKLRAKLGLTLGRTPRDAEEAVTWKTALKQLRKDEIFRESSTRG